MCIYDFSLVGSMLASQLDNLEAIVPGKGHELICAMGRIGDVCFLAGVAIGFVIIFIVHGILARGEHAD